MVVDGYFKICLFALRSINYREELTFDYHSFTESETEFYNAVCFCGSAGCSGTYLQHAGSGKYQQVIFFFSSLIFVEAKI